MRKYLGTSLVVLLLSLSVCGCGGSGTTDDLPSFYAGEWGGVWSGNAGLESGEFTLTINSLGTISGSVTGPPSTTPGGAVTGTVNGSGHFTMLVDWPGPDDYVITGTMTKVDSKLNTLYSYTFRGDRFNGSVELSITVDSGG